MARITEVLPDVHHRLWVTSGDRTLHMELNPGAGPEAMLSLTLRGVFARVAITDDGLALRWPGGFTLALFALQSRQEAPWLTSFSEVPTQDRYRPLLPLLRHGTPGLYLRDQPERHHVMQAFGLKPGELDRILRAYPVPEDVMLHRLNDIALVLRHHVFQDLPPVLLRRPWPYAEHRHPQELPLHTLQGCLERGRLDLIEDPLWALVRAELSR